MEFLIDYKLTNNRNEVITVGIDSLRFTGSDDSIGHFTQANLICRIVQILFKQI